MLGVSLLTLGRLALEVPRSSLRTGTAEKRLRRRLEAALVVRIGALSAKHPTFGYRKLWALLTFGNGLRANLKSVYRLLKAKLRFVRQRTVLPRQSVAAASTER